MKTTILSMGLTGLLAFPLLAQEGGSASTPQTLPAPDKADELTLDLQSAINYAITYNRSLQNARLDVEKSDAFVWENISQGLPQIDGTLDYMTYFNYELEFNLSMGGADGITEDMLLDAFNQTQAVFPGYSLADVQTHAANSFYDAAIQEMLPPSTILMSDASTAKLQVSQLIFSGQYIVGIQTAKLAKIISEQNYNYNEQGIKESVITSYYLVLITEESLDILQKNMENLEETLRQTEALYNSGMAELTDVDQIRITVNQLQNSVTALERNLELNYNMFRFQLGLKPNVGITLTDNLQNLFLDSEARTALAEPFSVEENITYQLMKSQENINEKLMAMEKWNYAPTLAGFYNYNAKILTTDFDMNPNHLAGLTMSVPIFSSGLRKARVDQARLTYEMSVNDRILMEDQLNLQERQLRYNLASALDNFDLQRENVEVAQRVYDSYNRKYSQGMATSLDLTQANSNYLDAESNYMQSILEVLNAKLALDKLMNKL